ncbi:hypothetical protein OF83DRAFT_1169622 [Amylostereum chailletii]|nr:hypothetical protein OF83DRAFT_1169622 [Amylostereum chailletii]
MSLKITIRGGFSSTEAGRSVSSNYTNCSDEDEQSTPISATEPKRSRSKRVIKPPKRYREEEDEIDVVGLDTSAAQQIPHASSSGSQKKPKPKPKIQDTAPPPPKKKKNLVLSDESEEETYDDERKRGGAKTSATTRRTEPAPFPLDFDDSLSKPNPSRVYWTSDEEDDRSSHKPSKTAYLPSDQEDSPPSSPRRKAKGAKITKASIRKRDPSVQPVAVKDERRMVPTRGTSDDGRVVTGSKRPRDDHGDVDIDGVGPNTSTHGTARPVQTVSDLPKFYAPPALPSFKKRKVPLPTMKKNKAVASSSTSGTPSQSSAPSKPRVKPLAAIEQEPGDSLSAILKKPTKEQGKPEVDLMDKNVYASLFKNTGVSAPRSGLDTKSKEERRKQLDKLRQEDQARRAAQWEHTFDLRTQHDKIMVFVEKMQARRSTALYPNILAATVKNEYDKKMRGKNN